MNHLTEKRNLWFLISIILLVPGVISLIFTGLRLGIDFTGGSQIQLQFAQEINTNELTQTVRDLGYENAVVQSIDLEGGNAVQIKLEEIDQSSPEKEALYSGIRDAHGDFTELSLSTIGSAVSTQLQVNSILAIVVASIFILVYIALAFRNTKNPMLYGICAIIAMVHDVLLVLGLFSILGWAAGVEVDTLFVTAILTVLGFSVHDTIVVFDRIRENLLRRVEGSFEDTVNYSLAQTIVRSLNTSITVVFTLLALYLFGGESTQNFVLALLVGIVAGTYSSIFNAAQMLVAWENGEVQRLFRRLFNRRPSEPAVAGTR